MPAKHTAVKACLLVCLLCSATPVTAEIIASRFTCAIGNEGRTVELIYLDQVNSVPCEITEQKYKGEKRTLWRAEFDVSFCQQQMSKYRNRLQTLGWPCETATIDKQGQSQLNETRALGVAFQAASSRPSENKLPPDQASFYDGSDNLPLKDVRPETPRSIISQLTDDEIRELDDWLIYLSAQSMLSIRYLMSESDKFADYQLREDLDSDNIYVRLQNRIEFLHSLLADRQSLTPLK